MVLTFTLRNNHITPITKHILDSTNHLLGYLPTVTNPQHNLSNQLLSSPSTINAVPKLNENLLKTFGLITLTNEQTDGREESGGGIRNEAKVMSS